MGNLANQLSAAMLRLDLFLQSAEGRSQLEKLRGVLVRVGGVLQSVAGFVGGVARKLYDWRSVLIPVGAGILAIVAALKVWRIVTAAATAASIAFNLVLAANPVGLVVLAVVGLAGALVVAYKRSERFRGVINAVFRVVARVAVAAWGGIKAAGLQALQLVQAKWAQLRPAFSMIFRGVWTVVKLYFSYIKTVATTYFRAVSIVWGGAKAVFNGVRDGIAEVATAFRSVGRAARTVWSAIKLSWGKASTFFNGIRDSLNFRGMFDGIKTAFRTVINWVIGKWNNLSFGFDGISLPKKLGGGRVGGFKMDTPNIPLLADGGRVQRAGSVIVGERGPEMLSLPRGAVVSPLDRAPRAQSVVIKQYFSGNPDMFAASQAARFQFQSAGLVIG
jgi:phage-related protein